MNSEIQPFNIAVAQDVLDDLQARLALTRFPKELTLAPARQWEYGTPEQVQQVSQLLYAGLLY